MNVNQQASEPDNERRILEAAAEVFMKKGKLGTSMQDIADQAGINRTLLHYYFRNKEKLFDRVFSMVFDQAFPAMVGIVSSDRPFMERIELFIEAYTNLLRENPYLPVFLFQEVALNPGRLADMLKGRGVDPVKALGMAKAELENAGLIGMDPRHFFASMMGMVLFPYVGRPIFQALAFQGDERAYDRFLDERTKQISYFIRLALTDAGAEKNKS